MLNGVMTEREEQAGWASLALFGLLFKLGFKSTSVFMFSTDLGPHLLMKHLPPSNA